MLGRVELAGKVIEHEWGYRAERARIVELIPVAGTELIISLLGKRLGVAVGQSIHLEDLDFTIDLADPARMP